MKLTKSGTYKDCMYCSKKIPMGDIHYHQKRGDKHYHLECVVARKKKQIGDTLMDKIYRWLAR